MLVALRCRSGKGANRQIGIFRHTPLRLFARESCPFIAFKAGKQFIPGHRLLHHQPYFGRIFALGKLIDIFLKAFLHLRRRGWAAGYL